MDLMTLLSRQTLTLRGRSEDRAACRAPKDTTSRPELLKKKKNAGAAGGCSVNTTSKAKSRN